MAKLSKEELIQKISEKIEDSELQVELMEDISDSFEVGEAVDTSELDALKVKYEELLEKYKSRFLGAEEVVEAIEEVKEEAPAEEVEEIKEEEVIDVNEI